MTDAAEFDHLVLIVRDRLDAFGPAFEADGYRLTAVSKHNIGSINRLITLESAYAELLGWPPGAPPARKEIASSPLGFDALVFRTNDATETHRRLAAAGFEVNPVLRLERPITVDGRTETARFDTVRFATQPLAGFRVYFCQHLTPELVWTKDAMAHPNGAVRLDTITVAASEPEHAARTLGQLAGVEPLPAGGDGFDIPLPNLRLAVRADGRPNARIEGAAVRFADGHVEALATHIPPEAAR